MQVYKILRKIRKASLFNGLFGDVNKFAYLITKKYLSVCFVTLDHFTVK